jgi:hypothetical protein
MNSTESKNPRPPKLKRPPTTIRHAKLVVGRVIRQLEAEVEAHGVDSKLANALVLACNSLVNIINGCDLERRLAVLEGHVANPAPWRPGAPLPPLSSSAAPWEGSKQ